MVRKSGISKKMHVINFKTEKKPKMKFFDFRAFRKNRQKLSREKYIFHMLFRAFHNTPRILIKDRLLYHLIEFEARFFRKP